MPAGIVGAELEHEIVKHALPHVQDIGEHGVLAFPNWPSKDNGELQVRSLIAKKVWMVYWDERVLIAVVIVDVAVIVAESVVHTRTDGFLLKSRFEIRLLHATTELSHVMRKAN
jgi:hypothetical protein